MKRFWGSLLILFLLVQPGCVWRLWSHGNTQKKEEEIHDVYGTVQSVTREQLVVKTDQGEQKFVMTETSIKGSDFGKGAYVHVYYKATDQGKTVTMVVEKIK